MPIDNVRRGLLAAMSGLLADAVLAPGSALAAEVRKFRLLMTPEQSGVYHAYAILQTRASEYHPWLRPITVETGGFNYNVNYIAHNPRQWHDTMLGSATVLEWAARTGMKPFYPEALPSIGELRVIGGMGSTASFWMSLDPSIRTPRDFAGKNVSTGLLSQNEWGMYPRMLLDGWDLTKRLRSFNALGPAKNIDALLDGKVDAAMMVTFYAPGLQDAITPAPFNQVLAANRPFHYVDTPAEMIEEYNRKSGASFSMHRFEPNSLPRQPAAFTSFGNEMTVSAHKSFPDDLAYEFTKLWVKMGPVIAKYNTLGKLWTPQAIAAPVRQHPENAHPGALRAYKELGLLA